VKDLPKRRPIYVRSKLFWADIQALLSREADQCGHTLRRHSGFGDPKTDCLRANPQQPAHL